MDAQLIDDFMRAVYETGDQYSGRASADQIMLRLGLETTKDYDLYTSVAKSCEELGYIEKRADRYQFRPTHQLCDA